MTKASDREGFLFESTDCQGKSGTGAEDHLDCDGSLQSNLCPSIHGSHATGAESSIDPVFSVECLSDEGIRLDEQRAVEWAHFGAIIEDYRADRAKGQDSEPVLSCRRRDAVAQRS